MNEEDAIAFFRESLIALARSLPVSQSVALLRGALLVANDHPAMHRIRGAYMALQTADTQLELIAGPQGRFNFDDGKDGAK